MVPLLLLLYFNFYLRLNFYLLVLVLVLVLVLLLGWLGPEGITILPRASAWMGARQEPASRNFIRIPGASLVKRYKPKNS